MKENFFRQLGRSPADIDSALQAFSQSAQILSSSEPRMTDQYKNKWVGVYRGKIEAVGSSLEELTHQIQSKHIPLGEAIITHIGKEEKVFIL
jgi:hypothetical protein